MNYAVYDNRTGEIIHSGATADANAAPVALRRVTSGRHEIISFLPTRVSGAESYVVDGAVVERPSLGLPETLALPPGAAPVTVLSGLPEGTVVEMRGEPVPVVDGAVSIVPQTTDLHVAPPFPWRAADVRVVLEP